MNKKLKLAKTGAQVFYYGGMNQLKQEWVWGAAAGIGLTQGLKYNGSVVRGMKGSAYTIGVLFVMNGFNNVMTYWPNIVKAVENEE